MNDKRPDEVNKAEDAAVEAANKGGLSKENLADLLKTLGDDIVRDMLEDAGLSSGLEEYEEVSDAAAEDIATGTGKPKKPARIFRRHIIKSRLSRRLLFVLILVGILLLLFALNKIYMSASLNSDDPIQYTEQQDDISASAGLIRVNTVNVTVPTNGKEEYSISYSWAEDDEKYPSVPHAISVIYRNKGGDDLYSISLYRNDTTPASEIPKGKDAQNWFSDWDANDEDGEGREGGKSGKGSDDNVVQEQLNTGDIAGYYIHPASSDQGGRSKDYNNYSYYFAVEDDRGISVYILEGVLYDESRAENFSKIMRRCISSIEIKMPDTDPS